MEKLQSKHPTCAAVLLILEEAVEILRAKLNEDQSPGRLPQGMTEVKPEIQALAVGYGFEAMRNRSGPFSAREARDLAQRGFVAGWISREFQEKVDAKAADDIRAKRLRGKHHRRKSLSMHRGRVR